MTAPARRRPGSDSPIKLVAQVEEVRTPLTMVPPAASVVVQPGESVSVKPVTDDMQPAVATLPAETTPAPKVLLADLVKIDEKKPVTFGLLVSLKKTAETAVLRTAKYEGGYTSMAALVEGALQRELSRLAIEFNDGEPFPQNNGPFRQGRPLGS